MDLFNKLATNRLLLWNKFAECYPSVRAEDEEDMWIDLAPCRPWLSDSHPRNTAPIPNVVSIDNDCEDEISDIGDVRHHHYKPPQRSRSHGSDGSSDSPRTHAVGSWMKNRYPRIDETVASSYASQPIELSCGRALDRRGRRASKERYCKRMEV